VKRYPRIVCFLAALLTSAALAAENPPEVDSDGLHLVSDSKLWLVYARPGTDLKEYGKVILVDAYVSFRKNWEREQRRVDGFRLSSSDIEKIKENVATEFKEVFTEQLEAKGIPVVDKSAAGDDVLIVRPAIINLDVTAPLPNQQPGNSRTIADSAGQMTLYAELYDSISGELLVKAVDPKADPGFGGQAMVQSRGTNKAAVGRMVRAWADALANQLNKTLHE